VPPPPPPPARAQISSGGYVGHVRSEAALEQLVMLASLRPEAVKDDALRSLVEGGPGAAVRRVSLVSRQPDQSYHGSLDMDRMAALRHAYKSTAAAALAASAASGSANTVASIPESPPPGGASPPVGLSPAQLALVV
jgi:hypothetical protein